MLITFHFSYCMTQAQRNIEATYLLREGWDRAPVCPNAFYDFIFLQSSLPYIYSKYVVGKLF